MDSSDREQMVVSGDVDRQWGPARYTPPKGGAEAVTKWLEEMLAKREEEQKREAA